MRRPSLARRQEGVGCRTKSRAHRGKAEESQLRNVPVIPVVDDDESFREALARFLATFALKVRTFASGEDCLQYGELGVVSCLLRDPVMPGISGLEVTQRLATRGLRIATVFVAGTRQ